MEVPRFRLTPFHTLRQQRNRKYLLPMMFPVDLVQAMEVPRFRLTHFIPYAAEESEVSTTNDVSSGSGSSNGGTSVPVDPISYPTTAEESEVSTTNDVSSGSGSSNGGTSVPVDPISYPTTAEESEVSTTNDVSSGSGSSNGGTSVPVDPISYPTTAEESEVSTTNDVTSELGSSNEGTSLPVDATSYTTIRTNCLTSNGSVIQNGSLLVNEDCTRISTCDNGVMNYNDLYQCSSDAVFQRRVNGSVDFSRTWISYREGFGELDHEFWLGNDKLYYLTNQGNYQLRVDFVSRDGDPFYANFDRFRINNESDNYRLSGLGNYSGNAGGAGSLNDRLNYSFSTSDKNNGGCLDDYHCGWWFRECRRRCLNGDYHAARNVRSGISWYTPSGSYDNIKYTEMKIRPV
ncbi:hypothetical protein BSL78_16133 [Apostichopus japonicus]|uniref:Fibrinogen C-terminal domain-containing protein n=1 Tax=Stichopus japonicus TaxID=307972 RepID=A0A2G8KGA5_STIJA|nr:hypothetical protein BSL78_16133 [Apostichopus japonicus]